MQNHRLIPYKFKSNMHLFYQEKIRWFKTKEFFPTEERFLSHRSKQLLLGEEEK